MTSGPSLEAADLSKAYSHVLALDSVSFRYEGPGAIGYLGPNGAGKTTTLKLFTGLLRPTRGRALVDGIDVAKNPKAALANVGALIETPEPYPRQSVEEALQMVGEFRGIPAGELREQIGKYAEALDLPPRDARIGRLSKGQKQRVVFAATLLGDPGLLLLDEPTNGLDPAERVRVREVLQGLKKDRLIFMSSHLLQEVTEVCDRVLFLNRGKILLEDSVTHLTDRFKATRVDVEFSAPVPIDRLSSLQSPASKVEALSDRRFRIEFDGSNEARARILVACQGVGAVVSFSSTGLVLEDAYLQLLQGSANGGR
jgi:ABC-2 type transport system ATP-binding protein